MAEITYIEVTKLYPHPDNPRKDVGDVSELADSIKAVGILQNLTVVPGHRITDEEWKTYSAQYRRNPTEENRVRLNQKWFDSGYTVIISHRRLAAAKKAGLTELPCVVLELTHQEQVGTMLLENIQRSDLTVYEQAQGFQMMLDLGETVDTVAQKTGFSQSTVRRRVKLLDLDKDKFKQSEARGATLQDYMELDKITDPALKNQVLDAIGTANFQQMLKSAVEKEKTAAYISGVVKTLETFTVRIETVDYDTMSYQGCYSVWNKKEVQRPEDAGTTRYYFRVGNNQIDLYRQKMKSAEDEAIAAEQKRLKDEVKRLESEMASITKQCYELRRDFIRDISCQKRYLPGIAVFVGYTMLSIDDRWDADIDYAVLSDLLGLAIAEEDENIDISAYRQMVRENPEYGLLCTAYAGFDNSEKGYFKSRWNVETQLYEIVHDANNELDMLYDFLISIGYEMSDTEKQLRDGTHPLFDANLGGQ